MDFDVAVVGAGPTGLTLANLLGQFGLKTALVERSGRGTVVNYPRAVGIDHDALRTFQGLDLVDQMLPDIIQNTAVRFFSANGSKLVDLERQSRQSAETGWYRRNMFMQHLAERVMADGLDRYDCVEMLGDTEVVGVRQDSKNVTIDLRDVETGQERALVANFLVGADGAKSTVRKLAGLPLEGETYEEPWLIIEIDNDPLDAPYSSFFCDPARPIYSGHLPHGHRRWG